MVQCVADGFNVCIFAFGQSGAGKTFTMTGPEDNIGIAPRAFNLLYDIIKTNSNNTYMISMYMVELYNDTLKDLLSDESNGHKLEIVRDKETDLVAVCFVVCCY